MFARSKEVGLLLDYFFEGEKAALSAPAAAGLCGLTAGSALSLMELLEAEGILRGLGGRSRRFCANAQSRAYQRCRFAYLVRR